MKLEPSAQSLAKAKAHASKADMRKESMAALDELYEKRTKQAILWGALGIGLAVVGFFIDPWAAVPGLGIAALTLYMRSRFTSDHYYSLPHSRDANGKHRCIFCGHRGIYKQGEYQTSNTHASCTGCENHLFTN